MNHQMYDDVLVVPTNFIQAIRESGYLSLATALAELIDNSIQAEASSIDITVERSSPTDLPTISVEDNGSGMDRFTLAQCLRFGGSSRFDSRRSFGRFGMGLPAASLSQARRVEVTTWQPSMAPLKVALDTDAVAAGTTISLEPSAGVKGVTQSGCRVVWHDCDRIEYRRLAWLERSLRRDIGRMFRRFLRNGLTLRINGKQVSPADPLLIETVVDGYSASQVFEPLRYEIATASGGIGQVTITFSLLPVTRWHHLDNATKRRMGVVGHGGVSILRAGREIANGWHFMGNKRKENYDDWWRCQIEFEPDLDEQFGITINKQGIRPTDEIREALEPELESVARILNARVRQAFEEVKFQAAAEGSCRIANAADPDLPLVQTSGKATGALSYRLGVDQLLGESMFDLVLKQRTLDVTMNIDHPGFSALYRPLQEMGDSGSAVRTALELLVLSFARSIAASGASEEANRDLLKLWGTIYGRMLQKS